MNSHSRNNMFKEIKEIKNVIQKNQWKIQGRKLRIKGKIENRRNNMFKERKQIVEEKIKDFHWSYEKK